MFLLCVLCAPTAQAEVPFSMDGTRFSGCKAAEPYALLPDASFNLVYREQCIDRPRPIRTPRCADGRVFDMTHSVCVVPRK